MMKKYLMIAASSAALLAVSSAGAINPGIYVGATAGYTSNSMQLKAKDTVPNHKFRYKTGEITVSLNFPNATQGGFNGAIFVGHHKHFGEKWTFDTRLFGSYDTSKVTIAKVTGIAGGPVTSGNGTDKYEPRFGFGLGIYVGHMFNDKIDGYVGVAGEMNFAKIKAHGSNVVGGVTYEWKQNDSLQVFSVTPTLGVRGEINDKMAWMAEAGYKIGLNVSGVRKNWSAQIKNKPAAVVAKVGISYHF